MTTSVDIFAVAESNVRSYSRQFPVVFTKANGAWLTGEDGRQYLDLLSGAGTLNYGHNNPAIIEPVIEYLRGGGVVHSLDLHTAAKARFLQEFCDKILRPRKLDYKIQFTGPTGTNAIEAALKLAPKVTGRVQVAAFTGAYHGMSLGSLAATCNPAARAAAGLPLAHVAFLPYEGYLGPKVDTIEFIEAMLTRPDSGCHQPAAILIELVQGEGGLSSVTSHWLRRLSRISKELGALLIVDDIQGGCGGTGRFFSFEELGVAPDIVVLSKSLSGFGAPFSVVLMRPDIDVWNPGEHTGTFRGNNLAFVGAAAAIDRYWSDNALADTVQERAQLVRDHLSDIAMSLPAGTAQVKGRGLLTGLEFLDPALTLAIQRRLFEGGVIVERCGVHDQVLKLLPPLIISQDEMKLALDAVREAVAEVARPRRALAS